MALVAYSDSEGSDSDAPADPIPKTSAKSVPKPASNYTFSASQPNKIKVSLGKTLDTSRDDDHGDEPPAKRPRTGQGAFSGFNSMLPAPKRDNVTVSSDAPKTATRKIFSLKTGAEASFSRSSDAELRNTWAEQEGLNETAQRDHVLGNASLPIPSFAKPPAPAKAGTAFAFKPLSVARNGKKKKPMSGLKSAITPSKNEIQASASLQAGSKVSEPEPKKKINLFSIGQKNASESHEDSSDQLVDDSKEEGAYIEDEDEVYQERIESDSQIEQPQTLDSIASDLNLTAAQRRQLFGRANQGTVSAANVVNFNTDVEYAANQALIAGGETIQHNPVRAIAPGKHNIRQLMNAASTQKEALEESFAEGRRNKREAGNKYGW